MRKFFLATLATIGLGVGMVGVAVNAFAQVGPIPVPIPNCSIPAGGCAQVLGEGCRGQCTDGIPGNDIGCRCREVPSDPNSCYCEAYDPWWGG